MEEKELKISEYYKYFFEGSLFFMVVGLITAISEPVIQGINQIAHIELGEKYSSSIFIDHMPTTTMSSLILSITSIIFLSAIMPKKSWNVWGADKALQIIKFLVDYARVSVGIMLGISLFLPFYSLFTGNHFYWKLSILLGFVSLQFFYVPFVLHQLAHSSKTTDKYWKRIAMVVLTIIVCAIALYMQTKIS